MSLQSGFQHPPMAESSLPLCVPSTSCQEMHTYQIICPKGQIIRKGCFTGGLIHISTRLLPRGEKFMLRITNAAGLIHEGHFKTC
jgi:hypothetical protein